MDEESEQTVYTFYEDDDESNITLDKEEEEEENKIFDDEQMEKKIQKILHMQPRKTFVFILCPPQQGSTILVNLLDSSKNSTTLLNQNVWAGESNWLIEQEGENKFKNKKWNPDYKLNMKAVRNVFIKYFDHSKDIYVEKSPSTICRAKMFEDYFSQYGDVWFLISIRSPYSTGHYGAEKWVKYAKYQRKNIKTLKNTIVTSYEDICTNLESVIGKIKTSIPALSDIHNQKNQNVSSIEKDDIFQDKRTEKVVEKNKNNERCDVIHDEKVDRIIEKNKKNKVLKNHRNILQFFKYDIIN